MLVGKCSRPNSFIILNEHARSSGNIIVRFRFLQLFETIAFALFASAASICFCSANGSVQCPANAHARRAIPVPTRPLFSRELPVPWHVRSSSPNSSAWCKKTVQPLEAQQHLVQKQKARIVARLQHTRHRFQHRQQRRLQPLKEEW